MKITKPLLITTGEPSGIGMDIVIDVLVNHRDCIQTPLLICADKEAFLARSHQLYQQGAIKTLPNYTVIEYECIEHASMADESVMLLHIPCYTQVIPSVLDSQNAAMVKKQLDIAHTLAIEHKVGAIITAPIQKSVMIQAGICLDNGQMFSGHTEYFMHKSGCDKVVMMLANQVMKVALVTTHLPLKDVANAITAKEVATTVSIVYDELVKKFAIKTPKILVCGLNPHAGENGYLGREEIDIINPVLQQFKEQGMDISLCLPADTLFTPKYLRDCDAVIAMYHDQGLAPLKSHGFGDTVNITLGLPYIRTSVDHGTALDLAGTGYASSSSLIQAINHATRMVNAQNE